MLTRGPFGGGAASGKVGSVIFSHCAQGQYIKSRVKPVNPRSSFQHPFRNTLRQLAPIWASTLTPTQRASWATYAANVTWLNRLGDAVHLSGMMEFCRSNWLRLTAGLDLVTDGPTTFDRGSVGPAPTLTLAPASNVGTLTMDVTAPWIDYSTETALLLFVGIPRSGGITFQKKRTRRSAVVRASVMPLPEFTFGLPFTVPDYLQSWPAWVVATMADGRLTTPVPLAPVYTGPPPPPPWIEDFLYADGSIDGNDGWISPTPTFGIGELDIASHTLIGAAGQQGDATSTDSKILNTWTRPWSLSAEFLMDLPNDGDCQLQLIIGDGSAAFAALVLYVNNGDGLLNRIGLIELGDTEPATVISVTNTPCVTGVNHTIVLSFDGSTYTITLDGTPIGSGAGECAVAEPAVTVIMRNASSTTTISWLQLILQQSY